MRSAWSSGDPGARVAKVLFAVDPTAEVAREAADWGADLLVVHHPLFLKPVHGFAADHAEGHARWPPSPTRSCALLTAHTNADQAVGGVSEAMALALGLADLAPLLPAPQEPLDKLTVVRPGGRRRGPAGGARRCRSRSDRRLRPRPRSAPRARVASGRWTAPARRSARSAGSRSVDEVRLEVVLARARARCGRDSPCWRCIPTRSRLYDVVELADPRTAATGTGRIGDRVERPRSRSSRATVRARAAATAAGVRVAGRPGPRRPSGRAVRGSG